MGVVLERGVGKGVEYEGGCLCKPQRVSEFGCIIGHGFIWSVVGIVGRWGRGQTLTQTGLSGDRREGTRCRPVWYAGPGLRGDRTGTGASGPCSEGPRGGGAVAGQAPTDTRGGIAAPCRTIRTNLCTSFCGWLPGGRGGGSRPPSLRSHRLVEKTGISERSRVVWSSSSEVAQ